MLTLCARHRICHFAAGCFRPFSSCRHARARPEQHHEGTAALVFVSAKKCWAYFAWETETPQNPGACANFADGLFLRGRRTLGPRKFAYCSTNPPCAQQRIPLENFLGNSMAGQKARGEPRFHFYVRPARSALRRWAWNRGTQPKNRCAALLVANRGF